MAKKSDLYDALVEAQTAEEVEIALKKYEKLVLASYGLRVLGWAWDRENSKTAPYAYTSFKDRVPKTAGAIELWAKA